MQITPMPGGPALLVVGRPGHELRVHGWLERARPMVLALTDGSGHTGVSRLGSTASLIDRAGAVPGPVFGRFSDAALYRILLDGNLSVLMDVSDEISDILITQRIAVVVGDDAEGYNPAQDVCRILINAAVNRARQLVKRPIANLAFPVVGRPDQPAHLDGGPVSQVLLDDAALRNKINEAGRYPEMAAEVAAARKQLGDALFRTETFRHVPPGDLWVPVDEVPFYETYDVQRVAAGADGDVIRYRDHIRPLADALAARPLRRAS
jgi:hypothetical protein